MVAWVVPMLFGSPQPKVTMLSNAKACRQIVRSRLEPLNRFTVAPLSESLVDAEIARDR
jgi:hypothetical protein